LLAALHALPTTLRARRAVPHAVVTRLNAVPVAVLAVVPAAVAGDAADPATSTIAPNATTKPRNVISPSSRAARRS
jgi:hypothetical protein